MKILIDENKYLTCFCIDADLENGIEVADPAMYKRVPFGMLEVPEFMI